MKRFMKGCAVTALIFAVLGSMLAFVGSSVAGRTNISQVVDAVTNGKIHVDSSNWWNWHFWTGDRSAPSTSEAVELAKDDIIDETWQEKEYAVDYGQWDDWDESNVEFKNDYEITKGNVDRFCPGEDIRKLELELGGCVVNFAYSENGYLYLQADNAYKFQSHLNGNTLHVKAEGRSMENWADTESCSITLFVPTDYAFDEVEVNLGAGYVQLEELYAKKASFEVGAGEIDISYAEMSKMDISVGAGSVIVADMAVDELDAEIGMGSFQAEGDITRKADIECSMGYVSLYLNGEESDFNYKLDGSMGNIEIGGMSFSGFGQEKKIENGASKDIEVECSMGNISILFME